MNKPVNPNALVPVVQDLMDTLARNEDRCRATDGGSGVLGALSAVMSLMAYAFHCAGVTPDRFDEALEGLKKQYRTAEQLKAGCPHTPPMAN